MLLKLLFALPTLTTVVAQHVKEQVGYDLILLNNKLYPILDTPSTLGDFWQSTSQDASGKAVKIVG